MTGLRVVPTFRRGQERLYVCLPDGRNVAWYDREAARVYVLSQEHDEEVLQALSPFLTGQVAVGPPPVPTPAELARLALHPDDDLAPNRPGESLRVALDSDPSPARRLRPDPRRRALEAEEAVGSELDELEGVGWRTLHSIPLPGGHRIHHLLIGPAGLFLLHSLYARRQRVRVGDPVVAAGRGAGEPLLQRVRGLADRASFVLAAEVRPVLALFGPSRVEAAGAPRDVRVLRDADVAGFAREGGVLKPADVESVFALARDRRVWLRL